MSIKITSMTLHAAARAGDLAAVEAYLGHTNIQEAINALAHAASTNSDITTPLFEAVCGEHLEVAQRLLQAGALVNTTTKYEKQTALHQAVSRKSANAAPMVALLLEAGGDVAAKDREGATVLHLAAGQKGNVEVVKHLLAHIEHRAAAKEEKAGQQQQAETTQGEGSVEEKTSAKEETKTLESETKAEEEQHQQNQKPAKEDLVNAQDKPLRTPLHFAASADSIEVAKLLLDAGADVNAATEEGATVLHYAASRALGAPLVELFIEAGADVNEADNLGCTALCRASRAGHIAVIGALCEKGASPDVQDDRGATALHEAVFERHLAAVQELLRCGADTTVAMCDGPACGMTPLHRAAFVGSVEIAQALIEHQGKTIEGMVDSGSLTREAATVALREFTFATVEGTGMGPLHVAAAGGYMAMVEYLLGLVNKTMAPMDLVDQKDESGGRTPLQVGVNTGSLDVVNLLLSAGASVDVEDDNGTIALHRAVAHGHTELLKPLLDADEKKSTLEKVSKETGKTALHMAVTTRKVEAVKVLLAANANLTVLSVPIPVSTAVANGIVPAEKGANGGETPLHTAISLGSSEMVNVILDAAKGKGAGWKDLLQVKNSEGQTPMEMAMQSGNMELAAELIMVATQV